jgi:hypothetical protein
MSAVSAGDKIAIWLPAPYFGEKAGIALYDPNTDSWDLHFGAPGMCPVKWWKLG